MKKFLFALIILAWLVPCAVAQQDGAGPAASPSAEDSASQQPASQQPAEAAPDTAAPGAAAQNDSKPDNTAEKSASEEASQPPDGAQLEPATADNSPQQSAKTDGVVEEIVARVNNSIITRTELERNRAQVQEDAKQDNLPPEELHARENDSLRDLIDQQLLLQKAAELGISADADLIKRLDDIRKQMKVGSMEELQKIAESQGISWEEFKQNTKNSLLTQKVIGSEVGGHIQITQDEIQKYYDEHKDKFTHPERIRLSEILLAADPDAPDGSSAEPTSEQVDAAREKAAKVYAELKAGAHFDEIARKESNGPTAAQGGDLGYFKRHDLALQLEAATFDLKIGDFTQPIRTRQGFLILCVTDRMDAGATPLESVRDQIQDQIYNERIQPALRAYLTKLRNEAYVDVRAGYTDTGASKGQASLIYATDSGPVTKQVRGKFGIGKKKTVLADDTENPELDESSEEAEPQPSGGSMADATGGHAAEPASSTPAKSDAYIPVLDAAKAKLRAAEDAEVEAATPAEAAAAKAQFDAAEKEMLAHMSHREQSEYFKHKKKDAAKEARRVLEAKRRQQEFAQKHAQHKSGAGKQEARNSRGKHDTARASRSSNKHQAAASEAGAEESTLSAAEQEKLSHMSHRERAQYLKQKKREAEKQAEQERREARKQHGKKSAESATLGKNAGKTKGHKKQESAEVAKNKKQSKKDTSGSGDEQADANQPAPKKKKFSWF